LPDNANTRHDEIKYVWRKFARLTADALVGEVNSLMTNHGNETTINFRSLLGFKPRMTTNDSFAGPGYRLFGHSVDQWRLVCEIGDAYVRFCPARLFEYPL
jgi:hypothetical protein